MRGVYEIRDVVHQISLLGIAHDAAILLLDMRTDLRSVHSSASGYWSFTQVE